MEIPMEIPTVVLRTWLMTLCDASIYDNSELVV
jgi:hypothetical protein